VCLVDKTCKNTGNPRRHVSHATKHCTIVAKQHCWRMADACVSEGKKTWDWCQKSVDATTFLMTYWGSVGRRWPGQWSVGTNDFSPEDVGLARQGEKFKLLVPRFEWSRTNTTSVLYCLPKNRGCVSNLNWACQDLIWKCQLCN
jgi:hypothetical protein